jgi:2-dehydropantoate 2-reductase
LRKVDRVRLLVVGAGSTGGYFGGRLAAAGRDVTFLVRPGRAAKLESDGLEIISPHGNFHFQPKLITADKIDASFDTILLTVKSFSLDSALNDLRPAVGPETMILPVLNGMRHVDVIRERFGEHAFLGGVGVIASVMDDQGRIVQLTEQHDLAYGEMNGSQSTRTEQLDAFMQNAGFNARLSRNIEQKMWEKWVMLSSLGAVNCLMRGNIGEIEAAPGGSHFAQQLLAEVIATVTALGHPPRPELIAKTRELVTGKDSTMTSSMYRDLHSGNPVEADQIVGDLLARARKAGVETPLLAAVYANLCVYQNRLAAKKRA